MKKILVLLLTVIALSCSNKKTEKVAIAIQTDFGRKDSAVASMYGVALTVDPELKIFDLTHEIPVFNIWEGALRLNETASYWPKGTVFVSVVDPGVGTERPSVVMKSKSGHYFVTPDNGTLTFVADKLGIEAVREIDEAVNRRADSEASYTFHGRDVYIYTAARLASGKIKFEDIGRDLAGEVSKLNYEKARYENNIFTANIPILDVQYGNVWSSLPRNIMLENGIKIGDKLNITIKNGDKTVWQGIVPIVNTFGDVKEGENLAYFNSELNFALAVNWGNFSEKYKVYSGPEWSIFIKKVE